MIHDRHRITVERAREAYRASGVEPIRCRLWEMKDGYFVGACPVGAVYSAEIGPDGGDWTMPSLADLIGLNAAYVSGFVRGFDSLPDIVEDPLNWPDFKNGFEDGRAVAREMLRT